VIHRTVAAFYREFMACLRVLGIEVTINMMPSEVQQPIVRLPYNFTREAVLRSPAEMRKQRMDRGGWPGCARAGGYHPPRSFRTR
jgi:hypothetical protein